MSDDLIAKVAKLNRAAEESEHPLGMAHERRLADDLKRMTGQTKGRMAIHLHLSRIEPHNRPEHTLRSAEHTFNALVGRQEAQLYWFRNNDFLLIFNGKQIDVVRSALVKLRFLFAADPLLAGHASLGASGESDALVTWYRLESDHERLLAKARGLVEEHRKSGPMFKPGQRHSGPVASARRGAPLTAALLAKVETALMGANLSSHIRRQSICAVVGRSYPDPVFNEVFVSIADLRETMLPHVDLTSNPWLFQHLTQTLDRRVLATLIRRDDRSLTQGFSLNLNVQSILSEDFLRFDDSLSPGSHGTVVLELRSEDIYADLNAYFFARDFARQRGYRVCIDGLTWQTLPYVDARRLGADLVKLMWDDDLPAILRSSGGERTVAAIRGNNQGRIILARCDSAESVGFGQGHGITLFQGRHLDKMLRPSY